MTDAQQSDALLQVKNLSKRFGGIVATDDLSLDVRQGELHALIGPNGAGKTTLITQLTGQLTPDSGAVLFAGEDISGLPAYQRSQLGLARSFQITSLFLDMTALDNVALAVQAHAGHSFRFWAPARDDIDAALLSPTLQQGKALVRDVPDFVSPYMLTLPTELWPLFDQPVERFLREPDRIDDFVNALEEARQKALEEGWLQQAP